MPRVRFKDDIAGDHTLTTMVSPYFDGRRILYGFAVDGKPLDAFFDDN